MFSSLIVGAVATLSPVSLRAAQVRSATELGRSWDDAYLNPTFNTAPSAFVTDVTRRLKPGTALDVGMG